MVDLAEAIKLDEKKSHTIEVIVDRIVLKNNIVSRLRESIALACRESDGSCLICHEVDGQWIEKLYSTRFSCPDCDLSFLTPEPRSFSFNSPWGACPECMGYGLQGVIGLEQDITTFSHQPFATCHGSRLQPFPSAVTFLGMTIGQFSELNVTDGLRTAEDWMTHSEGNSGAAGVSLSREARLGAERVLPDIRDRLKCLDGIGIG